MNTPIDITGITLHTPRMTLRPWRESDLEDFYAYAKVDGVGQMAGWTPHKNIEESRTILKGFMVESYLEDGNQKVDGGVYGKSITDACLGWEKTERLIYDIAELA